VQKYGRYNVAQVITFGKLLARGVIRDVARVLGMPYAEADAMAKLIPNELEITLDGKGKEGEEGYKAGAYQKEPKLRELIESNTNAKRVWDFALLLEGLNRNAGMHAAGVVISNEELWKKTPLYKPSDKNNIITQYSLKFLEDVDLIKFDFLGLNTLTVISDAVELIEKRHNIKIDWSSIDMNDKAVYNAIKSGHTTGLFQIESEGMQQLNARLQPTTFEDIIAVVALYRPGPMESGMLDDFIERKHGRSKITYMFDELEPILKPTYGVIVYQEQVMQIVQTIGGFSLGSADLVRRAMGKKIKEEMDRLKGEFVEGAQKKGFERRKCEELFDLIVKFAGYGFNKSHSAGYAMLTFQTAWLKAHYPQEFMAALLTSEQGNTDKIVQYIDELERLDIKLLPPDITKSDVEFTPVITDEGKAILFGLGAIKGVGIAAVKSILDARSEKNFTNISDFISRIDGQKVNKKVIESLIKSGAFDGFGFSRRALLEQIETIIKASQNKSELRRGAANSLFGTHEEILAVNIELNNFPEYELKRVLDFERETTGLYISGHPLEEFKDKLKKIKYTLSTELDECESGSKLLFIGKVEDVKTKISKKGNKFGILTLLDLRGTLEFTIFESMLGALEAININEPVALLANFIKEDGGNSFRVLNIMDLEEAKKQKQKVIKTSKSENEEGEAAENININETKSDSCVAKAVFGEENKKPNVEIIVELSSDMTVLEQIHALSSEHAGGERRGVLKIIAHDQSVNIPLPFGINEVFIEKLRQLDNIQISW
jgi:DNA polymerase-3 subunit alpha